MRLTDLSIKSLAVPEKGVTVYADDIITGFGIRVSQAGTKSFVLTHGIRRQRETIGRVGIISLQEARAEAKRRLAEYTLGKSSKPRVAWDAALEEYLDELNGKRKPSTCAEYKRSLERHFRFGETKLSELTPRDILGKLDKLRDTASEQFHAYVYLRAFIRWAYKRHYLDINPMDRMEFGNPTEGRDRVLNDDELVRVWRAAGDSTFGRIVKLLVLTGQRKNEIAKLTGAMIEGDLITLPPSLTKNSSEHTFAVGKLSLRELWHSGPHRDDTLLFPARCTRSSERTTPPPFNGWSKCKKTLDVDSKVTGWTLHDLRRTFRTKWEELGISPAVSERYINHISGVHSGVQAIYNRHKYFSEMRAAVAAWEEHLQALVKSR